MARLEKLILRDDAVPRTWRERAGEALRSFWVGSLSSKSSDVARFFGHAPVAAGVTVNTDTAYAVSAFFSAASMIAWDVASLPLFLYRTRADGGREKFTSHPLSRILHDQANAETTAFQLRAALMWSALTSGNGYCEITRDVSDRPIGLWHLDPARVSTFRVDGGHLRYRVQNGADAEVFEPRDILHVIGPSPDGVTGFNLVQLARESLGLAIAAEKFGSKFFANGSTVGGILSGSLSEQAQRNLDAALAAKHRGADNSWKLFQLPSGMSYTSTSVNPRDSEFGGVRTYQLREIARFFRIPVSMIGDLERSTFSNFEQEVLRYYTSCLRPWLVCVEQELNAKLIAASERNIQHCEHVVEGFLRGDSERRANFYAVMSSHGLMTPNEIRGLENLPPLPGGDELYKPLNTGSIGSKSAA